MSQWGQPGFQYPMQTGFVGAQPQQPGFAGLAPQPTGFPGTRIQQLQQPPQPGFPNAPVTGGFLQTQPTGFPGPLQPMLQQRPPPPPIPPLPVSYQQHAPPPPPIPPQQTSFMNTTQPRLGGPPAPQIGFLPQQQQLGNLSLPQNFQQVNQVQGRGTAPKIPWALSKAEKKQYDQVFRAWDAQGTGFVEGHTALEVFGQSGLDRNDLARIWQVSTLADADNRGKLNLAEFYVAMGLIYRRLNGNDIPDELPAELVPPSSRDLDTSVNFLKDILKNDTRSRSPSGLDAPVSRIKERSFTSSSSFTQQGGKQDATVYKHEDVEPPGGFYQSRNRHVDRSTVRSRVDDASPATADITSIKRQLLSTQKMLDDTLASERSSDALDRELEDLRYRITRLQEDLEYVSKGPRTTAKEEERRRLERELVRLMHEEVPELEKKVEEREARREREKREWARDRDVRNERFGRYGGDDTDKYSSASRYRTEEERPYSRSASRYDRDDRDNERESDRTSFTTTRTPPTPVPTSSASQPPPPPPPPQPARSPAPATKKMTIEERQAFIRAEAQRRLEERKVALGVTSPSTSVTSPAIDTTIEDRLAQEKREAEEKVRDAERQAEEREKQRREKLEAEKALKEGKAPAATPTTTAPPPAPAPAPLPTRTTKHPPPPPPARKGVSRNPITPTVQAPAQRVPPVPTPARPQPPAISTPSVPVVSVPVVPQEDPEDAALKAREEALRKKREEHAALLRKLEEEEEEARKAEAAYQERRNKFLASKTKVAPAVGATSLTASSDPVAPAISTQTQPTEEAAPPPPAPPAVPLTNKSSNNPFSRILKDGAGAGQATTPAAPANGSGNPFSRMQPAPPAAPTAPLSPKSPSIPPPVKSPYPTGATVDSDEDWDDVKENDGDDSSEDEFATRKTRVGLAEQIFRTQSAGPAPSAGNLSSPVIPPPPPPSAPPAPAAQSILTTTAPTGDRGALLSAIQGGARLRKTVTNDRSGVATSGRILGDASLPSHINETTRPSSPPVPFHASFTASPPAEHPPEPLMGQVASPGHGKKESVDWYNALAADSNKRVDHLPVTSEEGEEEVAASVAPSIQVSEYAPETDSELEIMADVDLSSEIRVRSLYPYEGQRTEELGFETNMVIVAHPSKSGGDWWYGTTVKDGKTGFFPQTYVEKVEHSQATALYPYEGSNSDELSFQEGDMLTIVDRSETDWWKAERDGFVFIVPAAYLELSEDFDLGISRQAQSHVGRQSEPVAVTDIYSTPYTSPQDTRRPTASRIRGTPSISTNEDDEEDAYYSLDEEDTSESELQLGSDLRNDEHQATAREMERQRVLEAAGLVVSPLADRDVVDARHVSAHARISSAPAMSTVTRSHSRSGSGSIGGRSDVSGRRRRPAPAPPLRATLAHLSTKDLPPIPTIDLPHTDTSSDVGFRSFDTHGGAEEERDGEFGEGMVNHFKTLSDGSILRTDDAFERYETFKKMQHGHSPLYPHTAAMPASASASRMSMSSFDTGSLAPTSPPRSPASVTPSLREREREVTNESRTSQFLSFLGRHTRSSTPDNNAERDRKLVISGPIMHAPTPSPAVLRPPSFGGEIGDPTREGSPMFGSCWASLVDRSALEGIPKEERRRQEAIFELISTEADYVRDVQLIVELFYSRLIEVLDEKAAGIIFLNIEDILLTNTTFLSSLEERQRDCRLYIDRIGDLLERNMPNMGVYLNYCVDQANAGKALQQMRETNPALAFQLQNLREDPSARNLDLSSYLLVPMQRLTRYPLLIRQILHYTDSESYQIDGLPATSSAGDIAEKQSISTALQTAEKILEQVNETIRDREGYQRLEEISRNLWIGQGRLDLTAPTRYLGQRKLVKEGLLSKAKSGRKLRAVLCSDTLVLLDDVDKGLYCVPIPVTEIQVKPSRTGRVDPLIRLRVMYPRGGDTVVLRAANVREAKAWGDAIVDTGKKALQGIKNEVRKPGEA